MDSQGRKVIVCDNGTGVRTINSLMYNVTMFSTCVRRLMYRLNSFHCKWDS